MELDSDEVMVVGWGAVLAGAAMIQEAGLKVEVVVEEIPADYCIESLVVPVVDYSPSDSAAGCREPDPYRVLSQTSTFGNTRADSASKTVADRMGYSHSPYLSLAFAGHHYSLQNCSVEIVDLSEASVGVGLASVLVPLVAKYSGQTASAAG